MTSPSTVRDRVRRVRDGVELVGVVGIVFRGGFVVEMSDVEGPPEH